MNNPRGRRRRNTKRMHMRHDIVPSALLLDSGNFKLGVFDAQVRLHLLQRFGRDVQAQFPLRFGKVEPELPPCAESVARGEDVFDFWGAVAGVEGAMGGWLVWFWIWNGDGAWCGD